MPIVPVLIAGPTASGKSALARRRAREHPSVIINADAMQVYSGLRLISARPSEADEAETPHRLYGHVAPSERYSVGRWLTDVITVLAEAAADGRRPIIVGGTGLYFRALTTGLADIPAIPPEIRETWIERAASMSAETLHHELALRSESEAARLRPSDRSRILRALEVFDATGVTLAEWHRSAGRPPVELAAARVVIVPQRADLHRRIDARFVAMLGEGALREAEAFSDLSLPPDLPAMKAIGLGPLLRHLRGEIDLPVATAAAQAETRQYAKRQLTWFRHQMADWTVVESADAVVPG